MSESSSHALTFSAFDRFGTVDSLWASSLEPDKICGDELRFLLNVVGEGLEDEAAFCFANMA